MKNADMVDYRKFRFSKLNTPEFSHLKLLIYWPVFGILFFAVERLWVRNEYYAMYCPLDDYIPFAEIFVIPYFFWFIFLIGIHLYGLLFEVSMFRKLMKYIMITYSISLGIFLLFPTCQGFRPTEMPRDNWMTGVVSFLYSFDTDTNVCPSLHVVGSFAVQAAAWNSKRFSSGKWRFAFTVTALLISVSTIFLRQHSILDLLAAVPVCMIGYRMSYGGDRGVCAESQSATG